MSVINVLAERMEGYGNDTTSLANWMRDVGLLSNQWSINEAYCIRAGQGELRLHWIIDWAQSKDLKILCLVL